MDKISHCMLKPCDAPQLYAGGVQWELFPGYTVSVGHYSDLHTPLL